MAFMNAEVTDKQRWVSVDRDGTDYFPADLVDTGRLEALLALLSDSPDSDDTEYARSAIVAMIADYTEQRIDAAERFPEVSIVTGYGVRSSASGFLDSTPWTVHSSKAEALRAAREEQRHCEGID